MTIQDEALSSVVENAITQDKRISGEAIAVRASEGQVYLKGIVDTEEHKELAISMAKGVAGVRHVNADELRVKGASR